MDQIELYIALLAIVTIVGVVFRNSTAPIALLLVLTGMLLSLLPGFPPIHINSKLILDIFLPLLLYDASAYTSSWKEIKKDLRSIAFLSVGHVLFITVCVALVMHWLIPAMGWPLAFVLGAVVSPPDDVAILSIAEKIRMPRRVVNILIGEAMLNDAAALIIFRFALAAVVTHQFSAFSAISSFFTIVICETLYGLVLGYLIGEIRLKIRELSLQMMLSILTPFLAYLPAEKLGGSGVIATVVTGLYIGHFYWEKYPPDVRLTARSIWSTLSFAVSNILFLLVGLDLKIIYDRNAYISFTDLAKYSISIILVVIIGRFIWVYFTSYAPRFFSSSLRKRDPYQPWQYPFITSWAGMRGGISLAAALAIPSIITIDGLHPKDLLVFLVFCVITATLLIQGLSLPWIMKILGIPAYGVLEMKAEHQAETMVRIAMVDAAIRWLSDYLSQANISHSLLHEIQMRLKEHKILKSQLKKSIHIKNLTDNNDDISQFKDKIFVLSKIIEVERNELSNHWRDNKIDRSVKNKLEQQLDLQAKRIADMA